MNQIPSEDKSMEILSISSVLAPVSKESRNGLVSQPIPDDKGRVPTPTLPVPDSSPIEIVNEFPSTSTTMKKGTNTFYYTDNI